MPILPSCARWHADIHLAEFVEKVGRNISRLVK